MLNISLIIEDVRDNKVIIFGWSEVACSETDTLSPVLEANKSPLHDCTAPQPTIFKLTPAAVSFTAIWCSFDHVYKQEMMQWKPWKLQASDD